MLQKVIRTQINPVACLVPGDFPSFIRDLIDCDRDVYYRVLDIWEWGRSNAIQSHIAAPWSDVNFMRTMVELYPDDIPF